ncbi:MAG: PD40 domain-containing protein [Candidatus Hydrogenedentes bacterium]|nr:PD40 domain-containing protein [Candidatus Hydrogenedentota bacterium]
MGILFLVAGLAIAQGPSGTVAFVQQTDAGQRVVCVVDAATGAVRTVGAGPWDGAPVWSPDGSRLAFGSESDDGAARIRIVGADGSAGPEIAHADPVNYAPAWSPDGGKLAYGAGTGHARHIRVYDTETGRENVWGAPGPPNETNPRIAFQKPVWLTNTLIAAVGIRDDESGRVADLYKLEQDSVTPMVETRGLGIYVEWAPTPHARTGQLAYESNDGGDREIFVTAPQRLNDVSNHRDADWNPVWSADGARLAFESFRGGSRGIYRTTPQGTVVTPVAADPAYDNWSPTWSPDGAWIAFVSMRTGKATLHACRADGSDARAITTHEGEDFAPAWRPTPAK